ncbi:hypothetical protein [Flavobacterium sp.]|uniref:hypothetical protein n=1 Tax=Flavobacterium sp. TaxID=239 RepID=UPI00403354A3
MKISGIFMLLISCKSTKPTIFDNNIFWYDNLGIREMIKVEGRLNSIDISEKSRVVAFGINLYPNEKEFNLQKPKVFLRNSNTELPLKVFYQFSNDSINRLILYEWDISDALERSELSYNEKRNLNEKCILKFNEIVKLITSKLGEPKEDTTSKSNRREVKWMGKNGLNVFLISFGPNPIRLSIYKE